MAFKTVFIAHAPDADPEKHHNLIETGKYKLKTKPRKTLILRVLHFKDVVPPGIEHSKYPTSVLSGI